MALKQNIKKLSKEEQATIIATSSNVVQFTGRSPRVLLLKPYAVVTTIMYSPPIGLLQLASALREKFKHHLAVEVVDMKVHAYSHEWLIEKLNEFKPDIVGFSALNFEAGVTHRLSETVHRWNSKCITAIGGPYPLHQSRVVFEESDIDWVFEGSADRTFPEAVRRHIQGEPMGTDLPGVSWRTASELHITDQVDAVSDLDGLPMPAWDLCEFDMYAKSPSFNPFAKKGRYAVLFTSRGCPYLCSYCHDIFTKKFKWQSTERVIAEIEHLYTTYGVTEFQIVDDIFNLHKPRVLEIMNEVHRRWPGKMGFCFPNGLRGDILDQEVVDAMVRAGTYYVCIAVETVTPRLQTLIEKHLDADKARWAIDEFDRQGVTVTGFFMLGFPTETIEEMNATVRFALDSRISLAYFFTVVPQPETGLYKLAMEEGAEHLETIRRNELGGGSYRSDEPWYALAYDFDLTGYCRKATLRFHLNLRRALKLLWRWPKRSLLRNASNIITVLIPGWDQLRHGKSLVKQSVAAPASLGVSDMVLANPEILRPKKLEASIAVKADVREASL